MRTAVRLSRLFASKTKVESFSRVVIVNNCRNNKVVCRFEHSFAAYTHFIFPPGSEQADRWIGLSDRDSLQVASKGQLGDLSLEILAYIINLKKVQLFFRQTFAWSDTTPVTFTNWGAGMPRFGHFDNFKWLVQCVCVLKRRE